jgi:adenylate kinase
MQPAPFPFPAALIFGIPGAGKGTQGDILKVVPGFFHVSSGVVFRQLDRTSEDGKVVRDYIRRGELVPDDLTIRIFLAHLEACRERGDFRPENDLLLLDGIPRDVAQCRLLKPYVDVQLILHLVCRDEEAMIERIRRRARLENRLDDASEEVTRKRFEIYYRDTVPVLSQYDQSLIREIDSGQTQAEVLLDCLAALVPVFKRCFPRNLRNKPAAAGA